MLMTILVILDRTRAYDRANELIIESPDGRDLQFIV